MRLKKLIVHGFKSFADRTEFDLERGGLTCIVGPNGCGKSNVLDAIKWVLGEQRPTSLRGKEMTDVIFNGTIRRPPMGLSEATLVFDNRDRTLPHDDGEVRVTRRVFRTGETEYLLNGNQVRLKDFRDLFAGTGLGAGGYAFLEQGKIDSILASNPVDRRRVFEEAAGISRFRARKHECELKLTKLDENLSRLADVIEEVQRQVRSLKIHAGKARSWREITERLGVVQRAWAVARHRGLTNEEGELQIELDRLSTQRQEAETEHEVLRQAQRDIEAELATETERASQARTRHAEIAERLKASREKLSDRARYSADLEARLTQRERELSELGRTLEQTKEELIIVGRERAAVARELQRTTGLLGLEEEQMKAIRGRGAELHARRRDAEAADAAIAVRLSEIAKREARLDADIHHLDQRVSDLGRRRQVLRKEREEIQAHKEERVGSQDAQSTALDQARSELRDAEGRAEDLEVRFNLEEDEGRRAESAVGHAQARRDVLDGLLRRQEGLDEGTKAILAHKAKHPEFLPGLRGLLLDRFDVDLDRARAVEAALGEAASALVVNTGEEALAGLRFLRERGRGSAIFLPLDRFAGKAKAPPTGVSAKEAELAPVLGSLLDGFRLVDRAQFESTLTSDQRAAALLVSEDGAVLKDRGLVVAPRGGEASPGLVVLRAERQDLDRKLPELTAERERQTRRLAATRAEREAARSSVKEQSVALLKAEGDAARLDQEVMRLVRELERREQEEGRAEEDAAAAAGRAVALRADLERLQAERAEHDEQRVRARHEVQETQALTAEHAAEVERAQSSLEAARIALAQSRERAQSLESREQYLTASVADATRRLALGTQEREELSESRARLSQEITVEEERQSGFGSEASEIRSVLKERESRADQVRERLRAHTEQVMAVEAREKALHVAHADAKGREGAMRAGAQALVERVRDELGLELPELLAAAPEDTASATADPRELDLEIKELKDRISRLGNVNHAAIDELEEAEKRSTFILAEKEDLDKGREELRRVLKGIEEESTALFMNAFNSVREHFSNIFRKLFGGGKADILLENEATPLESGIEIKARPPGKELRSITLLSGGERSMTAVALLFAIFRAHPAPCAFLDEVDAALDEDNTERFVRMVEEARGDSQFVVVTHSKRTMERADLLFGVTMPERGVSRRVAVRLEQLDDQGNLKDVAAVERAAAAEPLEAAPTPEAAEAPVPGSEPVAQEAGVVSERSPAPETPAVGRRRKVRGDAGPAAEASAEA